MNTYYLKKFRKLAHKLYGIIWYEDSLGNSVWNMGKRRDLVSYATVATSRYYSEKDAIKALEELRRNYISTIETFTSIVCKANTIASTLIDKLKEESKCEK